MTRFAHRRLVTSPSLQPDQLSTQSRPQTYSFARHRGGQEGKAPHRVSQRSRKAARRERSRKSREPTRTALQHQNRTTPARQPPQRAGRALHQALVALTEPGTYDDMSAATRHASLTHARLQWTNIEPHLRFPITGTRATKGCPEH